MVRAGECRARAGCARAGAAAPHCAATWGVRGRKIGIIKLVVVIDRDAVLSAPRVAAESKLKGVVLRIWPLNPTANGRKFGGFE